MKRHVIFDFFGTLVTYSEGITGTPTDRGRAVLAGLGLALSAQEFSRRFEDCFAEFEAGASRTHREYSMQDVVERLFEQLGVDAIDADVERFVGAYLKDWNTGVKPLPGLEEWLSSVSAGKSVLTNTHQRGFVSRHLERLKIDGHIQHVTSSVEHGRRKPDPAIYQHHLAVLNLTAAQVVFVGDNPQCDYHGPRSVGIEAYLVAAEPVAGVSESHRLRHLYELREHLV